MNPIQPKDSSEAASASRVPFINIPDHELIREIGRGSYGEVWLARNALGTYRAVKIVYRQTFAHDRPYEREFGGIQKFEPVSRAHEGLVDILQVGRNNEAGHFYYVMELADDVTAIRDIVPKVYTPRTLAHEVRTRGRLPVEECIALGLALTSGLSYLHKQGLIHRDIKPSNVIFVNGIPKLADIGLVTDIDATRSYVGTEGFIPPEGPGTPQSDIYSLGKVLYEISTGKDRQDYPELPTKLDETASSAGLLELNEVIIKACRADPQDRYQSADTMHADLLLLHAGRSVKHVRKLERRLVITTRIGIAAAILAVLALGAWFGSIKQIHRARRAEHRARESLREAYLAQARASRWSGRVGRRFQSLEALTKAAQIRPGDDLRNEAVACLILADAKEIKHWQQAGTMSFHPNLKQYARIDSERKISLHDTDTDEEILALPEVGARVRTLRFSPDGRFLAAIGRDQSVEILDCDAFQRHSSAKDRRSPEDTKLAAQNPSWARIYLSNSVPQIFTADSRSFSIVQGDYLVFCDPQSGRELKRLPTERPLHSLSFSPACPAFSTREAKRVYLYDAGTGYCLATLAHPQSVNGIAWHPDGKRLAAACADNKIHFWDLRSYKELFACEGHLHDVIGIDFNHSGTMLASSSWDGTIRLWNSETSQELFVIPSIGGTLKFSLDDQRLSSSDWGSSPSERSLWTFAGGGEVRNLYGHHATEGWISGIDFSSDGRLLASSAPDGLRFWDCVFATQVGSLPIDGNETVRFLQDGSFLTSGAIGVTCWSIQPQIRPNDIEITIRPCDQIQTLFRGQASLASVGKTVLVGGRRGAQVFQLDRPDEVTTTIKTPNGITFAEISPDGKWAATCDSKEIKIWDPHNARLLHRMADSGKIFHFSPDGKWLVTSSDAKYQFWQVGTWVLIHSILRYHGNASGPWAFSCDGKFVAIAYSQYVIHLVDTATWKVVGVLESSQILVALQFSPDSAHLSTGLADHRIQLWDLRLIRKQLATMGLDWDMPQYPPEALRETPKALHVTMKLQ